VEATSAALVHIGVDLIIRFVTQHAQPPQRPVLTNQLAKWQFGWTAGNLQQCLVDNLTFVTKDELFKCPDAQDVPVITMTPPYIYAAYIPAGLISPEGSQDPPIVPSILIELHQGEVDLPQRPTYLISVRLLVSLWDDDPAYLGWMDSQHLTEKIFLYLLKERSLSKRYNLVGKASWQTIRDNRANYYISVINLTYDMDMPPDASDNIAEWMLEDDHRRVLNLDTAPRSLRDVKVIGERQPSSAGDLGDTEPTYEDLIREAAIMRGEI
jgi:hypothetical protein